MKRTGLALLIGIDRYAGGIPTLQSARNDARALADALQVGHGYEVVCLLDEQATKQRCMEALAELRRNVTQSDRVIFYFAGHGIATDAADPSKGPAGFLVPVDAQRDDLQSFLPMSEVRDALAQVQGAHLLVLLDCCFAGAFRWTRAQRTRNLVLRRSMLSRQGFERYRNHPARQVITSAAQDEKALDVVMGNVFGDRTFMGEHSPFAMALMEGLSGKADWSPNGGLGDGVILCTELYVYIENQLAILEKKLGRPVQRPLVFTFDGDEKGEFLFLVPGHSPTLPDAATLADPKNNPYRGLSPYLEADAGLFFGRRAALEKLTQRVLADPLVVVTGAAGSGKTSLIRAGLVPRLRSLPQRPWKLLACIRPGSRALTELRMALDGLAHGGEREPRHLLVIDQLEELVTMSPAELPQFLGLLDETLRQHGARLHVVAALRAEFESFFREFLAPREGIDNRFMLPPFTRAELLEAVEGPAAERTLFFEPKELSDDLVHEVLGAPAALPLLSFVLAELVRIYASSGREGRTLRSSDYSALGGMAGALSHRAEQIVSGLDAEHTEALCWLLFRMITPGDWTRRNVYLDELALQDEQERARTEHVRRVLMDARLLAESTDMQGRTRLEPAHDKLVLSWPRLRERFDRDRQMLLLRADLSDAVRKWAAAGRPAAQLWTEDMRLASLLQRPGATAYLSTHEHEFLTASRRRSQRDHRLRLAVRTTLVTFLSGMCLLFFLWYRDMRRHWEDSRMLLTNLLEIMYRSSQDMEARALRNELFAEVGLYVAAAQRKAGGHEALELQAELDYCQSLIADGEGAWERARSYADKALQGVDASLRAAPEDPMSRLARGLILLQLAELALKRQDSSEALRLAREAERTTLGPRADYRQRYVIAEALLRQGQILLSGSLPASGDALSRADAALRRIDLDQPKPGTQAWSSLRRQRLSAELDLAWAEHSFRSRNSRLTQHHADRACKQYAALQSFSARSTLYQGSLQRCAWLASEAKRLP